MKNKIYITLVTIIFIVYFQWFNPFTILTDWDWMYTWKNALKTIRADYFTTWLSDYSFWRPLIDLSQAPTYALLWFLSKYFWFSYAVWEKLVWFIPILLVLIIGSYKLFNYLFKWDILTILVWISIYCFNTYALTLQTWHITLAGSYAFLPLWLYFLHKWFIEENISFIIKSSITFLILWYYETRVLFLVWFILFIYFSYFLIKDYKKYYKFMILLSLIIILWNLFWLLPFKFLWLEWEWTLWRSLFWTWYWDLIASMSLHQPWWNFTSWIEVFTKFSTNPILFLYPLFFIISLFYLFKEKLDKNNKSIFIIFLFILLIWIFLGKMTALPFWFVYEWLYDNFPFFNAFREPTKFYILIAISYSIIIWLWVNYLKWNKKIIVSVLFIILWLYNLWIQRVYNTQLLVWKKFPEEYIYINNYINNDKNFWRILAVPLFSSWLDYSKNHPPVNMINNWIDKSDKYIVYKNIYYWIDFFENQKLFFTNTKANDFLLNWWVKYIILPNEKEEFFIHYWKREKNTIWNDYYNLLKKQNFLEEINLKTNTKIFLVKGSKDMKHILIWNWEVNIVSEWQHFYNINTKKISKSELYFLESYHKEWKIYLKDKQWLFTKPLFESSHQLVYDYANSWTISKDEIIKYVNDNYSKEIQNQWYPKILSNWKVDYKYYTLNSDWSIDTELTLYFKPQSYFYLWLIISWTTFIILIWYLGVDFVRNRRRKEEKNQTI